MQTRSVRFRITAVASLTVLIVLGSTAAALVFLQRSSLTNTIDNSLIQRAEDIEARLTEAEGFVELPSSPEEGFAQVVDADSNVIAATSNLIDAPPIDVPRSMDGDHFSTVDGLAVDDDVFRVLSRPLRGGSILSVGTTYDVVEEATVALVGSLALFIPLVVVVFGLLTWWLVGRTLRPVEAIRSEVTVMGPDDLGRRVPAPGTGDEIDRLAITMNQMLQRLQDSVTRESRFVSDVSHELRSPLTRLRGEIELLLRVRGPDTAITSLHEDVLLMQSIVEDLLFLARSDAGEGPFDLEDLDLDDLVLAEVSQSSAVPVDVSQVSAVMVPGSRSMLRRAVANLMDNARRHASSRIAVSLHEEGGWAVLTVADDGGGIPEGEEETIFDRFRRLDEARRAANGGTGLGLAIAREIAEAHGGSLRVVNPGEPGAVFELRIPSARPR